MYYHNNELPPQQGWICPKCGRVNAPWMPTCECVSSQTSGTGAPYLVKTIPISRDSHEVDTPQTEMDKCYKCKWWNYSYGCSNKKGICDFEQADTPQTDLVQDSPNLVKDLVEDYEPYEYEIKAWHKEHQEPYCEQADTPQTDLVKYSDDLVKDLVKDTPQTECDTCRHYKPACELFSEICKYEPTTQTETQNSNLTFDTPQTEERPAGCSKDWSTSCTSCERYFSCDYLSGRQTDCGWGKPTTVSHSKDKED